MHALKIETQNRQSFVCANAVTNPCFGVCVCLFFVCGVNSRTEALLCAANAWKTLEENGSFACLFVRLFVFSLVLCVLFVFEMVSYTASCGKR